MNRLFQTWFLLFAVFSYSSAGASTENNDTSAPFTVVGGVAYIYKNSDFTIANKAFKPTYRSIDWSFIFAYQKFYTRANFDQSIKDHTQVDNTLNESGQIENTIFTAERNDSAITFGYNILDSLSVFAGYKHGETSGISGGQIRVFNAGTAVLVINSEYSFTEGGPFIGFSYKYSLNNAGSLSFGLAYADLNGEVKFTVPKLDATGNVFLTRDTVNGDSAGLSYTLNWTGEFSESMVYIVGINIIRYKFDAPPGSDGDSFDFDNNFTNFSIGVSKYF